MKPNPMNEGENMKKWFIISGITFAVFFTEALIHYNYGIFESQNKPFKLNNFKFPRGKTLLSICGIVMVASTLSGSLITYAESKLS